jgi:phage gp46-like protein
MSRKESNDVVLTKGEDGIFDIQLDEEGDVLTDDFVDTSLLRSVYAERRATESEMQVPHQRRGWIGNEGKNFEDGSKVWLYEQSKLNSDTINGIKSEIENALEWLIEDKISIKNEVSVEINDLLQMTASIQIQRSSSQVDNVFYVLFENSGRREY